MVYFIGATNGQPIAINRHATIPADSVKIGCAVRPEERLIKLGYEYKRKDLTILATTPGGVLQEKELHRRFDGQRIRFLSPTKDRRRSCILACEWFAINDEIRQYIRDANARVAGTLATVEVAFQADDEFLMKLEYAARRAQQSVSDYVKSILADRWSEDCLATFPFRNP